MTQNTGAFEALLQEDRTYPPPANFVANANIPDPGVYEEANRDPEAFWARFVGELDWFKPWDTVLDWSDAQFAKWFVGKLNAAYNCIDRHLNGPRRNKAAIIWEGEPGDWQVYTYRDLYREVCKFANGLKSLGVEKGDRVTLYLQMVPELANAMLACARIGAPHRVVFGGFSAESLRGPDRGLAVQGDDHDRRRLASRRHHPIEAERRRVHRGRNAVGEGGRGEAHRPLCSHRRGSRRLVARPGRRPAADLRAGANGQRRHAVHVVH